MTKPDGAALFCGGAAHLSSTIQRSSPLSFVWLGATWSREGTKLDRSDFTVNHNSTSSVEAAMLVDLFRRNQSTMDVLQMMRQSPMGWFPRPEQGAAPSLPPSLCRPMLSPMTHGVMVVWVWFMGQTVKESCGSVFIGAWIQDGAIEMLRRRR